MLELYECPLEITIIIEDVYCREPKAKLYGENEP
jgi:hypothetical protein